jgi:hypothetical protein
MELYDMEREKAIELLRASGRDPDDFSFEIQYLPPDPDGGGMFTVRYEVTVTERKTGKAMGSIGGIGLDWVGDLADALKEGQFD